MGEKMGQSLIWAAAADCHGEEDIR